MCFFRLAWTVRSSLGTSLSFSMLTMLLTWWKTKTLRKSTFYLLRRRHLGSLAISFCAWSIWRISIWLLLGPSIRRLGSGIWELENLNWKISRNNSKPKSANKWSKTTLDKTCKKTYLMILRNSPRNCLWVTKKQSEKWRTQKNTKFWFHVVSTLRCSFGIPTWTSTSWSSKAMSTP